MIDPNVTWVIVAVRNGWILMPKREDIGWACYTESYVFNKADQLATFLRDNLETTAERKK